MLEHTQFDNTTFSTVSTRERQVPQCTALSTGISIPDPWSELLFLWILGLCCSEHTLCNTEFICIYFVFLFLTGTAIVVSDIPSVQKGLSKENIHRNALDVTGGFSPTLWSADASLSRSDTQTISGCVFMTCPCASMAFPPLLFSQWSNFTQCPISCVWIQPLRTLKTISQVCLACMYFSLADGFNSSSHFQLLSVLLQGQG